MQYEDWQKAQKELYTILSDGKAQGLHAVDFQEGEQPRIILELQGEAMQVTLALKS